MKKSDFVNGHVREDEVYYINLEKFVITYDRMAKRYAVLRTDCADNGSGETSMPKTGSYDECYNYVNETYIATLF